MRELDKIAEALFNKIRARFDPVKLGDEKSNQTSDPDQARFFNFDYQSQSGKNYGNVTVSLIDGNALKVYYSNNIGSGMEKKDQQDWYLFLRDIRNFAKRNMLTFDTRDINRSNLDTKSLKQQSRADSTYSKDELSISESKLYGTSRSSYLEFGPAKLIIRHEDQIDPELKGSRARKIKHLFVETSIGERFLLPFVNLHGGRAMAKHLSQGGKIDDEHGEAIQHMVKEMSSMRHFVRSMRNRTFEDAETTNMVEAAIHRYNEVKERLKKIKSNHGYNMLLSAPPNDHSNMDAVDVDALRERFVKKIYDDRFTEALPYVYRAYLDRQNLETTSSKEFESWATQVTEQTWADDQRILDLMEKPILAGVDAVDAIAALKSVNIDDEKLNLALMKMAAQNGADTDVRRTVAGWLASEGNNELANEIIRVMQAQNANTQPTPTAPEIKNTQYGAAKTDDPVVYEDLIDLKRLSGLSR